jgi:hypothetical protein
MADDPYLISRLISAGNNNDEVYAFWEIGKEKLHSKTRVKRYTHAQSKHEGGGNSQMPLLDIFHQVVQQEITRSQNQTKPKHENEKTRPKENHFLCKLLKLLNSSIGT